MNTISLGKKLIFSFFLLQLQYDCHANLSFSRRTLSHKTALKRLLKKYKPYIIFSAGLSLGILLTSEYHKPFFQKLQAELIKKGSALCESNFALQKLRASGMQLHSEDVRFALENLQKKLLQARNRLLNMENQLSDVDSEKEEYKRKLERLFALMKKQGLYTNGVKVPSLFSEDLNAEPNYP